MSVYDSRILPIEVLSKAKTKKKKITGLIVFGHDKLAQMPRPSDKWLKEPITTLCLRQVSDPPSHKIK